MFRIGHLGDSNDLTLLARLAGCEMGLKLSGCQAVPAAACKRPWSISARSYRGRSRGNRI